MAEEKKDALNEESLPKEPENKAESWDWDASVPQTDTDNITFDELQVSEAENSTSVETEVTESNSSESSTESDEQASENSDNDGCCIVCGKKRGNSPSDLYCNTCRAKFLKTNYGVGHIILAFVMVIVAALGYFVCTSTVTISHKLIKADKCLSENRYSDAMELYSDISNVIDNLNSGVNAVIRGVNENASSQEWFTGGDKTTLLRLESYAKTISIGYSSRSEFISTVDSLLTEEQLNHAQFAEIKKLYNTIKEIDKTAEALETNLNNCISQADDGTVSVKYDEAIAYLDSYQADSTVDKSLVDYYKFMMAYYAKKDAATTLGFLDNAYQKADSYGYLYLSNYMMISWDYEDYDKVISLADEAIKINQNDPSAYYYAVKAYLIKNDFDKADNFCEKLLSANPDSLDYYSIKAEVLRRQGKYSDAIETCRKGIVAVSAANSTDLELYRQQAIAYMLSDDKENAVEAITQAYELSMQDTSNGISLEVINTVALICRLCDDTDTYDEIVSIFKQQEMELSQDVQQCIKGDITFEDIFMKGAGEISCQ